jgi:dTMP kinase
MFITFEGGEGSGKTTQIKKLRQELQNRGLQVVATREPGGTKLGEHIRNCLLNQEFGITFGPQAELMLFLASRAQHLEEVILPALSEGKIVLCDRFNDSSVAYQGGGRQLGIDKVHHLCASACNNIEPDLTFFLDIEPEEGMNRISRKRDRLEDESIAFHQRVRQAFLQIAQKNPKRVHLIDARQPLNAVFSQIWKQVSAHVNAV